MGINEDSFANNLPHKGPFCSSLPCSCARELTWILLREFFGPLRILLGLHVRHHQGNKGRSVSLRLPVLLLASLLSCCTLVLFPFQVVLTFLVLSSSCAYSFWIPITSSSLFPFKPLSSKGSLASNFCWFLDPLSSLLDSLK